MPLARTQSVLKKMLPERMFEWFSYDGMADNPHGHGRRRIVPEPS